ncbi:response regulator [Gillisia sp. M10.2A]|uniref:histidine kinase n=1 Tax=Gillisia lutea TaxID=2909668 RepID=A0ABS9EFX9_9FLAO|nr:hybrid sensor histidine kinase/response regulator transcription factor [Gillisia lutea]MCF4101762.1 response regulator [Gillisia lutea]
MYNFESLKNNVTQRAVASISQDEMGFIWMGTNGLGLSRFNGVDYTSYQYSEIDSTSLSNSLIHSTYLDTKNRLWVGTEAGLDLYNRELDNFTHINLFLKKTVKRISVQAILEDKNGDILIGTHQSGLFKIDPITLLPSKIKITGVRQTENLLINSLAFFDNRILIGTNDGLLELDTDENVVYPIVFVTVNGKEKVSTAIKTMEVDDKGSVWLGTLNQGLLKIDGNENGRYLIEHFPITTKRVLSLLDTPRKTILCGTENDGMFEIDRKGKVVNHYLNNKFDNKGIKSNSIWSLFLDDQQRIWIGYYNNGVGVYDRLHDKFPDIESKPNYPNSLQSSSVTGIIKDDNNRLWIGMDGGGIDVYDPKTNVFTHLLNNKNSIANGLNSPDVQTLYKDSKGNIWVGTWDYGIYFLEKGSTSFSHYSVENTNRQITSNRILSFSEDSDGIIWIGTFSSGIHSFSPIIKKFSTYNQEPFGSAKISFSDIRKIYVDSEDNIWIGGNAGLFKFKRHKNYFKLDMLSSRLYNKNAGQPYTSLVIDLYEDSSKNIWIGTDGAGLCRYDMKKDTFSWMEAKSGFNKVTASSIIEDENGAIWVAGNNGLTKIDKENYISQNFSINDGLLTNDFNNSAVFKDEKGKLYFGSYEGINHFNPENLTVNKHTPTVYLTDFKLFNQPVLPGQEDSPLKKVVSQTEKITLTHSQSVFTIDYASIDFTRPEKIQFAYYLEGFEDRWNYVENSRSATYTNLPAGNYVFKVKAANSDGIWNDEAASLNIEILRPWWFTNFAIICYVLILALITYFTFKFLDSRLQARRTIAQEREKRIHEETLNNKKIQFFTNISHEFRTPLTLILSPLEDILKEASLPEKIKNKHKIIHKNTKRLKHLIDELMDFRKLQFNKIPLSVTFFNINNLVEDIIDHFQEEAQHRNIALSIENEYGVKNIWADKSKLEKIIFNILSNAFKSTTNNGIITLTIGLKENHLFPLIKDASPRKALEISIEDTGKGIHPDELNKIFDRFYQIKELNEQYYSGTGIGLEVVRSFIDLHKGQIDVESEIGVGTKFRILIPIGKEHYEPSDIASNTDNSIKYIPVNEIQEDETPPENNAQKRTLLVVEDNIELRTYIKQELQTFYKVIEAEDGEEGLKKAKKMIPDVVITDVVMPKLNGHELCEMLKNDLRTSHIPVLMLTAKSMVDDWVEGLNAGADVYLNKPFEMKVMRSHLKQLITNRELLFSKYMGAYKKTELEPSTSLDKEFISNIIIYTQENISEANLNVEKLADQFNLSRSQLYRKIKALTGLTANELIRKIRLERAKELIEAGHNSISEISYNVGFSSPSYFSKCFKAHFGVLPTEVNNK